MISIDPGTNACGFVNLEIDLDAKAIHISNAYTYFGKEPLKRSKEFAELYCERDARNKGYHDHLYKMVNRLDPYMVACEAPYLGRFANAFGALKEQLMIFRMACWKYSHYLPFELVEPSVVKKHMKVPGKSGDKDLMTIALSKRTDISYSDHIDFSKLDEHSIDAVCIGLYYADKIVAMLAD